MLYKNIGDALYVRGFHNSVFAGADHQSPLQHGAFSPASDWGVTREAILARYGYDIQTSVGNTVGERFNRSTCEAVIRHSSNPLNMENNSTYSMSPADVDDTKLVCIGTNANLAAFDSYFRPEYARLFPAQPEPEPPVIKEIHDFTSRMRETAALMRDWKLIGTARRARLIELSKEVLKIRS